MIVRELEDEGEVNFEDHFEREEAKLADRDLIHPFDNEIESKGIDERFVESPEKSENEVLIEFQQVEEQILLVNS